MDLSITTVLRWGQRSQDKPFWRTSQAPGQRLSWRCQQIIPTLGVRSRSNARPQLGKAGQEHSHSSKAQNRLGLDHGAWNEMQINRKTACYCLTSQICKGNHKKRAQAALPQAHKAPCCQGDRSLPAPQRSSHQRGETVLSGTWGETFLSRLLQVGESHWVWNPDIVPGSNCCLILYLCHLDEHFPSHSAQVCIELVYQKERA